MSSSEQAARPSPWISVWLKPRQTIEHILAERSPRGALLLGSLTLMAGTLVQLLAFGIQYRPFDWYMAAVSVIVCAIAGIIGLFIAAFLFKRSGRLLGGRASAAELRIVVAWGLTPSLLGLVVALVLVVIALAGTGNETAPAWVLA